MRTLENRIPPPLVAAVFALAMWALALVVRGIDLGNPLRVTISLLAVLLGTLLGLSGAVLFRRARTTVNPHKPDSSTSLVTSGVYRISRNPMYVGFALFLVALSVWFAFPWSLLGVVGFVLYLNRFQIAPEERALEALFGAEFVRYRAKVRRWL